MIEYLIDFGFGWLFPLSVFQLLWWFAIWNFGAWWTRITWHPPMSHRERYEVWHKHFKEQEHWLSQFRHAYGEEMHAELLEWLREEIHDDAAAEARQKEKRQRLEKGASIEYDEQGIIKSIDYNPDVQTAEEKQKTGWKEGHGPKTTEEIQETARKMIMK